MKIKLSFLFFIMPFFCLAQKKSTVDSLISVINQPKSTNAKKVNCYNQLALFYAKTDSAKTYNYANKAKFFAEKINDKQGIAQSYSAMGIYQAMRGHIKNAENLFTLANSIFKSEKNENAIGRNYNYLGTAYKLVNKYEIGLEYFTKARDLHQKNNDLADLATDLVDIGSVYNETDRSDKALTVFFEAAKYADYLESKTTSARLYINIGNILREQKNFKQSMLYYDRAIKVFKSIHDKINAGIALLNTSIIFAEQSNYKESENYLNAAISDFGSANFAKGLLFCYNNLGGIAIRQKKYQEGINYLNKAAQISNESKNFSLIAQITQNKAYALTKLGKYDEPEPLFKDAEKLAYANNNRRSVFGEIYTHWAVLDSARGDFKSAYKLKSLYHQIKDSALNESLSKQVNDLQIKYETVKKEKQIEGLNQEKAEQLLKLNQNELQLSKQQLELGKNQLRIANQNLELNKSQSIIKKRQLEAANKQQQISLLSKENTIQKLSLSQRNTTIGIVIALFFSFLVFVFLFYNRYKLKQEARLQIEMIKQQDLASKGIIEAEERERKRIALDLHDGVGQLFSAVKLNLSSLLDRTQFDKQQDLVLAQKTLAMVDESCKEVRVIAHQMMPNVLLKTGLINAIKDFTNKIDSESFKVYLSISDTNEHLDNDIEIVLYRVIQECVNNVIKHAKANRLDIQLNKTEKEITVTIEDNGLGFNTKDLDKFEGIGLKNIVTRLTYLKGTVEFSSTLGEGTVVSIYVPLI